MAFAMVSIITFAPRAKIKPIIPAYKTFLPIPNKFGFPAEIIIRIPPIVIAIPAKGIANVSVINLRIFTPIVLRLSNVQSGPLHGTSPSACVKIGIQIIDSMQNNNIGKNIFFVFMVCILVPPAGLGPADFWFEAKYDIQFHHGGTS
jgi:hypothetical protein